MTSATTLSVNELVSRALPKRIPQVVRTRLRRRIILTVRNWQLDHPFFQEIQREKKAARQEGLIDIADAAIRAISKARQRLGCSSAFREAMDRATSAQYEQHSMSQFHLAHLERLAREAHTKRMQSYWLRQIANHKILEEQLTRDSSIANQLTRAGMTDEAKGELSLAQNLDLTFSRAMTDIRTWVDTYHVPRKGDRESDATQLVTDLSDLMGKNGLTVHEIKVLLDALRGIDGILLPSEEALAKRTVRARNKNKVASQSTRGARPQKVPGRRQS